MLATLIQQMSLYHFCWFAKFASYILRSIDVSMCYKVAWQFCKAAPRLKIAVSMQGVVEDDVRFCAASGGAISLLRRVCPSETLPMNAVSLSSLHFDFASYFLEPKMCAWCVFSPESILSVLFISSSVSWALLRSLRFYCWSFQHQGWEKTKNEITQMTTFRWQKSI